jgi:hypothetical protein
LGNSSSTPAMKYKKNQKIPKMPKDPKVIPSHGFTGSLDQIWGFPKSWGYPKLLCKLLVIINGKSNGFGVPPNSKCPFGSQTSPPNPKVSSSLPAALAKIASRRSESARGKGTHSHFRSED